MYCIYQISNKINGKRYIGQHKYSDENNPMGEYKGSGLLLRKAYKKYGIENFSVEILYRRIRDKKTVDAMEIWAIEKYKPEYNIAKGGSGGDTYSKLTDNDKKKHNDNLSKALKGRKHPWASEMNKKRAYSDWHWWVKYNVELLERSKGSIELIEYSKPTKPNKNTNRLSSYWDNYINYYLWIGETPKSRANHQKTHSKEWNEKVSKSLTGRKLGESTKSKISNAVKGLKWWNNGVTNKRACERPSSEYHLGRIIGKRG